MGVGEHLKEYRHDFVVGNLVEDETEELRAPLYDLQIEAASIRLSPICVRLRRIGELRQEESVHIVALGKTPGSSPMEIGLRLAEGAFLLVDKQISYTAYLQNGYDTFPEISGYGTKEPGEIVVFGELKLRHCEVDSTVAVEMEVIEFPDKSLAEVLVPVSRQRGDIRHSTYNKLIFNPEHHRVGFIDYDNPDIEVF